MAPRGTRTLDATPDILERITRGESLRKACESNGIKAQTFLEFCDKDEKFAEQYARAKALGLEAHADILIQLADEQVMGEERKVDASGNVIEIKQADMIAHRKLQIDTRKWVLAKLMPQKYGDRQTIEQTTEHKFSSMTDEQLKARIAELAKATGVLNG